MTLTLGPTSPGAPASPGTPCRKGANGFGVRPGGFEGSRSHLGGDRGVSPDLRVCRSRRGDLVALAAPGRGQEPRENSDSESPGLGWHHPDPKAQSPKPCAHLEAGGAGGSLLSPLPCRALWDGRCSRTPKTLWDFRLPPPQDFGDPTSLSTTRAGDLWFWGSPSRSRVGFSSILGFLAPALSSPRCTHGRSWGAGGSGLSVLARKSLMEKGNPTEPQIPEIPFLSRASVSPVRGF